MSVATTERPRSAKSSRERVVPPHTAGRSAVPRHPSGAARYRVLFVVPVRRTMSDSDVDVLAALLNMTMHLHPKLPISPLSPGVARLDFDSGLYLVRAAAEDEWRLEARTWGAPAQQTIHAWHLLAADAARQLDPSVPAPARLAPAKAPATAAAHSRRRWRRRRRGVLRA